MEPNRSLMQRRNEEIAELVQRYFPSSASPAPPSSYLPTTANTTTAPLRTFQHASTIAPIGVPKPHLRELFAPTGLGENLLAPPAPGGNLFSINGETQRWDPVAQLNQLKSPPQPNPRTSGPTQMYSTEPLSATRLSETSVPKEAVDDESKVWEQWLQLNALFTKKLHDALEEGQFPGALGWSTDRTSFYLNQEHPEMSVVLYKYFNLTKFHSCYRQLKAYGFNKIVKGKNKGMMHHPHFYRGMGKEDFRSMVVEKQRSKFENRENSKERGEEKKTINKRANDLITKKKREKAARKAAREAAKMKEKQNKKVVTTKKASAVASKKNRDKSAKTASTKKSKGTTATSKGIGKKKTASVAAKSSLTNKKRKKPPSSLETTDTRKTKRKQLSSSLETTDSRKTKRKPLSTDEKEARKRLTEHKKLHNLFWKWDLWNFPEGLDFFLESGKVLCYVPNKTKKTAKADAADVEPEFDGENSQEKISHLLCDEEIPDSIFGDDKKDDEQSLADFVDRLRKDKLRHEKRKELWSNTVAPVVKGKFLPLAKFAKPTDKWKKLKVGDRVGVFWRDDGLFYDAFIAKQRENTSYFYLIYDDDGAREWLDLSREAFKILEKPLAAVQSPPRRAAKAKDETPQRNNRARFMKDHNQAESSKSISLPDSHSHLAPFVRHSWKGLGLGSHSGTPAYNLFVRERNQLAPAATALELLNDVRALRSGAFPGIPLKVDSKNTSIDSIMGNDDDNQNGHGKLRNPLRDLRDKISKENSDAASSFKQFDQTLDAVRKQTDNWSIPTLRENLRTMETQILKLKEREAIILVKCEEKGLYS